MNKTATDTLSPHKLVETTTAVAESLQMLNEVSNQQQEAIAALALGLARETVNLVLAARNSVEQASAMTDEDKESIKNGFKAILEKAASVAANSAEPSKGTQDAMPSEREYQTAAETAIGNAYNNAVNTQQQLNVTAQAALVQGIALLYSSVGTAFSQGKTEK